MMKQIIVNVNPNSDNYGLFWKFDFGWQDDIYQASQYQPYGFQTPLDGKYVDFNVALACKENGVMIS